MCFVIFSSARSHIAEWAQDMFGELGFAGSSALLDSRLGRASSDWEIEALHGGGLGGGGGLNDAELGSQQHGSRASRRASRQAMVEEGAFANSPATPCAGTLIE